MSYVQVAELALAASIAFALWAQVGPRPFSDWHRRNAHTFARRMRIPLTADLADEVAGRFLRRRRWGLIGVAVLGAVSVAVRLPGDAFIGLLGGLAVGRCVAQAVEARRAVAGGARVTHLLAPRLTDYVGTVSVVCVHLVALLPVGLGLVWFAAPLHATVPQQGLGAYWPALDRVVVGVAAAPLAALLFADIAGWLVLRLRRAAGTPAELAVDDAFRVTTLRDLAVLPVLAGLYGTATLGSALNHVLPSGPLAWLGSPAPGVVALALALAVSLSEIVTYTQWRRRLHPELVASS